MSLIIENGEKGTIRALHFDSQTVPFRHDHFAGPSLRISLGGKEYCSLGFERSISQNTYENYFWGCMLTHRFYSENGRCHLTVKAENRSSQPFQPDYLGLCLGIDSYMDAYPQWNDKYFPTFSRCEKTHFYGYCASPLGNYLGIASPDPIASWTIEYNSDFALTGGGHRIYTLRLDLLCKGPLPSHHPDQCELLPGETMYWDIVLYPASSVDEVLKTAAEITCAPIFCGKRLIYTLEEERTIRCWSSIQPELYTSGHICIPMFPDGCGCWEARLGSAEQPGIDELTLTGNNKTAQVLVYTRKSWSWYLSAAAKEAINAPQKTGSHVESWYGLYTGLLAERFLGATGHDSFFSAQLDRLMRLSFDPDKGTPILIPNRIQNTAGLAGLCADAFETTGDTFWLKTGRKFADYLADHCQTADGVYRSNGSHYTSVVYIAKSMLEISDAEEHSGIPEYVTAAKKHRDSANRAVRDLVINLDNIGTEGEPTFEDGMISCSMSQIALMALYLSVEERNDYIRAAEILHRKHLCLERLGSPDCRSRNTTCRFWEAQYDVLIPSSMMNSPHGWSAWKVYGTWYLYLLTGKLDYLIDTMETLGSCLQLLSPDGTLRWSFAVDPKINTLQFTEDPEHPGQGLYTPAVIGEQYIPMISHWYKTPVGQANFGYTYAPFPGFNSDLGGCCDNDVHEIFKALAEVALPWAYVDTTEAETFSISAVWDSLTNTVTVSDSIVHAVHVNFIEKQTVTVRFSENTVIATMKSGWIYPNGTTGNDLPFVI